MDVGGSCWVGWHLNFDLKQQILNERGVVVQRGRERGLDPVVLWPGGPQFLLRGQRVVHKKLIQPLRPQEARRQVHRGPPHDPQNSSARGGGGRGPPLPGSLPARHRTLRTHPRPLHHHPRRHGHHARALPRRPLRQLSARDVREAERAAHRHQRGPQDCAGESLLSALQGRLLAQEEVRGRRRRLLRDHFPLPAADDLRGPEALLQTGGVRAEGVRVQAGPARGGEAGRAGAGGGEAQGIVEQERAGQPRREQGGGAQA